MIAHQQVCKFYSFALGVSVVLVISSFFLPLKTQTSKYTYQAAYEDFNSKYEGVNDSMNEIIESINTTNLSRPFTDTVSSDSGKTQIPSINNWRNLSQLEIDNLSILGRRLYLNESIGTAQNRNFTILFWKTGLVYANRYLYHYGPKLIDPFGKCSVRNCEVKYEDSLATTADAILIHFHRTEGPHTFPNRTKLDQWWIWYTDESPYFTFMLAKNRNLVDYNGFFNWSMSYRMDSDIPVPYGRTVEMSEKEASSYKYVDYFDVKTKILAVMASNCGGINKRWDYAKLLEKHIKLDFYGGCGTIQTCPGSFTKDCQDLNDYKFYLAFENSNCQEYLTEKVWWNALGKGAVPVVMGTTVADYRKLLPPNSFIHVDDFPSPTHLANYLLSVAGNREMYMSYHSWRSKFKVLNEHGFFNSDIFHYCRICEALNYNSNSTKIYNDMESFWNANTQCYPPTWQTYE